MATITKLPSVSWRIQVWRNGVRKVNIDTDIRLGMTAAMRRTMKKNSREFDPRKFPQAAMDEIGKVLDASAAIVSNFMNI